MIVYDLCSGTGSATVAFAEAGHRVVSFENDLEISTKFKSTECVDIRELNSEYLIDRYGRPDFVYAGIPCTYFSRGTIGLNWSAWAKCRRLNCKGIVTPAKNRSGKYNRYWQCSDDTCERRIPPMPQDIVHEPKSRGARETIELVRHTLELIAELGVEWYVIENPVGMMRKLQELQGLEIYNVTYCQYGERRQKPTDLIGKMPHTFEPLNCKRGAPCHPPTPRGASSGTQGMTTLRAGRVPYRLSLAMCSALTYAAGEPPQVNGQIGKPIAKPTQKFTQQFKEVG